MLWTVLFFGVLLTACGYRFTGGGELPENVRKISVSVFENKTQETGLESVITNDLIYEFTRSGKASVTSRERAEAILTGVIKSMHITTASHKGEDTALERRVTIVVDLNLVGHDNRILWVRKNLSANETYLVESDKLATENNKSEAIREMSQRLAETVFNSMTDDF